MRIVILGAGQVGGTLANNLAHEDNDITLVDLDEYKLQSLQHRLDIQTVQGSASHPSVLIEAGIEKADMLIAVTNSDEINMVGCQIAYSLFRTPTKIARIRSQKYYDYPALFHPDHVPIDVCISPEKLVTAHIHNLIRYPGVQQILEFVDGKVLLATIKPRAGGIMVGKSIKEMEHYLENIEASLVALFRDNEAVPLLENTLIEKNDEVVVISAPSAILPVLTALGRQVEPNKRIIIAGGGHIGRRLAEKLENDYRIKIIDSNPKRAQYLASNLNKATVLHGDIGDRDLLINENIEFSDVFCAVTNDDEANIMSALQAKRLGVRHALSLVNKKSYVDLIADSPIDHAISPQLITIGTILTKLRRAHMIKVHRLPGDEAEAIELVIEGDASSSRVVGRTIGEIELPPSAKITAVVRDEKVLIAEANIRLQSNDHVILLVMHKRHVRQVEALFSVDYSFFHT